MKNKLVAYIFLSFLGFSTLYAQNKKQLTITEAVSLALENSDDAKIALAKMNVAESEWKVAKNLQYPDVSVSGQYMYLNNPKVDLQIATGGSSEESGDASESTSPDVHQIMLGQASVSMPIFSGFKITNMVKAAENQFQAATYTAKNDQEHIALQVIQNYIDLYKANQTIAVVEENLKRAHQRTTDFQAMEENGLLARNDLLKAQLQESNYEVTLEEVKKKAHILNFRLATLLKFPESTIIEPQSAEFGLVTPEPTFSIERNDMEALKFQKQAAENQIKVAQSKYFPSLALTGGYIALDIQNALTITNAMNIGVGLSYNLSDLFKAKSDVNLAKHKVQQIEYSLNKLNDGIKVEVENAQQEYQLAMKNLDMYTISEEQANENYRIVKDKYDNGLVDTNDLLEADVDQLQSEINLTYARANISLRYYELLAAKGQLINTFNQ